MGRSFNSEAIGTLATMLKYIKDDFRIASHLGLPLEVVCQARLRMPKPDDAIDRPAAALTHGRTSEKGMEANLKDCSRRHLRALNRYYNRQAELRGISRDEACLRANFGDTLVDKFMQELAA